MSKKRLAQSGLIETEDSILLIIDMQERLFPVMAEKEHLAEQVMKLVRFAKDHGTSSDHDGAGKAGAHAS